MRRYPQVDQMTAQTALAIAEVAAGIRRLSGPQHMAWKRKGDR